MEGYHGYATTDKVLSASGTDYADAKVLPLHNNVKNAGGGLFGSGGLLGLGVKPNKLVSSLLGTNQRQTRRRPPQQTQEDEGPDTTTIVVLVVVGFIVLGSAGFLTYKLS